jgi:hypothetical protein
MKPFRSFQVNMMSAQMLSSMSNTSAPVMAMADDMKMLEAQATAASSVTAASSEAKQNISFVRGEAQSKAVEEAQSQQVINLLFERCDSF